MPYTTTTLLAAVSQLDPFEPFLLNLMFPEVVTFDSEEIAFDKIAVEQGLAPFVSPYIAGKPRREKGGSVRSFVAPSLKPKDVVKPDRALKRRPGEGMGGTLSAEQRMNAIRMDILDEHRKLIMRRMEWMAAQFLRTGKIIVEGDEYPRAEVDFGRHADHTATLTSGARWSETTAKPVEDLEDWMQMLEAPASHVIFGRGAFRYALQNDDFRALVETRRGSETQLEMAPAANLAAFRGRFGGAGPELWSYTGYWKDSAGAKQLFIPDNGVAVISTGVSGVRAYGGILDAKAGYRGMELFPKNWESEDPAVEYLMTQSRPLTVPRMPDATLYATVYTA